MAQPFSRGGHRPEEDLLAAGRRCRRWPSRPVAGEPGWATWEAGAKVCALPLFRPEKCARLEVPALPPPGGGAAREPAGGMATRRPERLGGLAAARGPARAPGIWPRRGSFRALERVLGLPVAVTGEDLTKVSKALWMRYTLQLVRATGENIRNLDVIGLYRIPAKGTRAGPPRPRHRPAAGDPRPRSQRRQAGAVHPGPAQDRCVDRLLLRGGGLMSNIKDDPGHALAAGPRSAPDPTVIVPGWPDLETALRKRAPEEPEPPPAEHVLVVYAGTHLGRVFPLAPGINVIGRSPGVDLPLPDEEVSRTHAWVTLRGGSGGNEVVLEDGAPPTAPS